MARYVLRILRLPACTSMHIHARLSSRTSAWCALYLVRPPCRTQVRLFALYSRALTAGATVTAEEAARRAQAALVRWTGRGGLNEDRGDVQDNEGGGEARGARRAAVMK